MVQCDLLNLHNLNFNSDFFLNQNYPNTEFYFSKEEFGFWEPNYQISSIYCYQIKPIDLVFIWCHRVCSNFDSVPITIDIQKGSSDSLFLTEQSLRCFFIGICLYRGKRGNPIE